MINAAAKGFLILEQDMPSAIVEATIVDFTGEVAKFKDPDADPKPGAIWKGGWFEDGCGGWFESDATIDDLKEFHTLWLRHDSLEDFFTKWALTKDPFPSDLQVRSALSGEQFVI